MEVLVQQGDDPARGRLRRGVLRLADHDRRDAADGGEGGQEVGAELPLAEPHLLTSKQGVLAGPAVKSLEGLGWRIRNSCSGVTSRTAKGALSQSGQTRLPRASASRNASAIRTRSTSGSVGGACASAAGGAEHHAEEHAVHERTQGRIGGTQSHFQIKVRLVKFGE